MQLFTSSYHLGTGGEVADNTLFSNPILMLVFEMLMHHQSKV